MVGIHHIKKATYHARYTRPQWYHEYHQWEHHANLHWLTFIVSTMVILMGFINVVFQMAQNPPEIKTASAATTTVSQTVNAGTLGLTSGASTSLSSVTIDTSTAQTSTGNLGTVTVTDNRGSGVGWSVTATSTNFTKVNAAVKTAGSNSTVTSGGTYNNATGGTYTITINGGGASGVATFTVSGLETQTTTTTGSNIAIGTRGVTATFASATYVIGDQWTIRVDTIPVTGLTHTPGSVTTISGSSTGVTAGSATTFASTSDPATIMTASSGNGMGSYSNNPALSLTIPAATYANTYTATITETAQ